VVGFLRATLRNRGYVACFALLIMLAVGYQIMAYLTGMNPVKKAVPLRKPLRLLDTDKLKPYELIQAADIKPEILDALGTELYIQWSLEDRSIADRSAPERLVHLFVTYYTGTPGQVVHVPEECFSGGGYQQSSEELVEVPIPELQQRVPFKVLTFERSAFLGRESKTVLYTFHTNGRFAPDRHVVRAILNDPRDEYAYFSKIELSFGTPEVSPSREKAIEAGTRFLQKVIPVLVREHWPDWDAIERTVTAGTEDQAADTGPRPLASPVATLEK